MQSSTSTPDQLPVAQPRVAPVPNVVELHGVTVRLGGRVVLHNLDLAIAAGEFVGCIGPNGAGKTTLLRLLLGLVRPSEGSALLFGRPLHRGNRRVGYVPQHQTFFRSMPLRARDMVALGIDGTRYGPIVSTAAKAR